MENAEAVRDFGTWKEDIRDMIMRVREQFFNFIDEFTMTLKKQLDDIEKSKEMKEFVGEDRRQEYRLKNLEDKHKEISDIID